MNNYYIKYDKDKMGVYYYFINLTTGERNVKPIEGELTFIAKLDTTSESYISRCFEKVKMINNWKDTDILEAYPGNDDHLPIKYINGDIVFEYPPSEYEQSSSEEYDSE